MNTILFLVQTSTPVTMCNGFTFASLISRQMVLNIALT
ncbi:unnamed protein product [Protopolystoma xenopodis]|uniref:Uncharacterized protein n=1 Tax=Protopolystoma xenopodis TaxID=117903 RepID=A0A448X1B5_9PLAT|nr:unnamed protein product [Protopolystoma xenopodis]